MANKERGELRLSVGDQEYTLKLTTNACCEMEDRAGKVFDAVIAAASKGSLRDLRWLLWAMLQEYHSDTVITAQDVGKIIDRMGGLAKVAGKINEMLALNRDDAAAEGKPKRTPRG
jgi:hypothetical protein